MSYVASSNWRLVKCPRCLLLLPERDDFLLYKCGNCGIFLKAKNRRPENGENTSNEIPESISLTPNSQSKNETPKSSSTEEILPEDVQINQKRIFPSGSSSNGGIITRQISGSEVDDFHSARLSLSRLSLSKSGSKNSAFLGDHPPPEPYRLHQPRNRTRFSTDLSSFDYGSETTERYHDMHHHHSLSPGSSSSGFSTSSKKQHHLKRHCRPILGGSPLVICNSCLKLLQLPVDFLLPGRKSQKIRCGSCSRVLIFSFHGGGHIERGRRYDPRKNDRLDLRLHRLMGYPSARDIMYLRQEEDDDSVDFHGVHSGQLSSR